MTDLDTGLDAETLAWFQSLDAVDQQEFLDLLAEAVGEQWELSPKQLYADALWHKVDWMLYGGAAGGGKTELMIKHANDLSATVPGHSTLVVRQSIPELRRSIILRLKARIVQFRIAAKLRKVDGVSSFQYSNSALIECGYLATDEHVANYLSAEYDLIEIDEASLMTSEQIVLLASRLRTTKRKARLGARPHLGLFSNPGGPAHAWLYQTFVAATNYGQRVIVYDISNGIENAVIVRHYDAPLAPDGATREQILAELVPWVENLTVEVDERNEMVVAFVPAKVSDNEHIDPAYMKYLNALPERRRRQLRDGDWDTFEGQYFHEWNRDLHVVPWFEIPEGWLHARGADFGSTAPWACLMGAWDNDGNCYIYDECYGAGLTPQEQARDAKAKQTQSLSNGKTRKIEYFASLADPSVFADKRGTGKSIADHWRAAGFGVTRAKNARVAGWQNVRQYLRDPEGRPHLFVLDGAAPNLVRTMPLMQTDKKHPEDLDTTLEDHVVDALRYLLAARPMHSKPPPSKVGLTIDERFTKLLRSFDKRPRGRLFN